MAGHGTVRIIAGRWRRRRLRVVERAGVRPTPDRVRETLFNWLGERMEGARCLDLYAGSGALGFEAASRGAHQVVMVERDALVVTCLREQALQLGGGGISVIQADAIPWLDHIAEPFDIVFLDPPYGGAPLGELCARLERGAYLCPEAVVYLESDQSLDDLGLSDAWRILRSARAGRVKYHLAALRQGHQEHR